MPRLRRGSRIAIVSPASAANAELVQHGMEALTDAGYEPVLMPHALARGPLYYAGSKEDRVADLHAAFADESIDGIVCTRGGWGSAELLPLLNRELVCANPKVFVGYSDLTSLHAWLWNECATQSFHAPMVAADWSKSNGIDVRSWQAALEGLNAWELGGSEDLRTLRPGEASGRLLGGCLSILAEALGTPWALRVDEPTVLFVEDIGTKPYKWDRLLQHMRFAGAFEHVTGIVFGDAAANIDVTDEREVLLLEDACLHALGWFRGPVAMGLRCGHVKSGNCSVTLGAEVELQCGADARLVMKAAGA